MLSTPTHNHTSVPSDSPSIPHLSRTSTSHLLHLSITPTAAHHPLTQLPNRPSHTHCSHHPFTQPLLSTDCYPPTATHPLPPTHCHPPTHHAVVCGHGPCQQRPGRQRQRLADRCKVQSAACGKGRMDGGDRTSRQEGGARWSRGHAAPLRCEAQPGAVHALQHALSACSDCLLRAPSRQPTYVRRAQRRSDLPAVGPQLPADEGVGDNRSQQGADRANKEGYHCGTCMERRRVC